MDNIIRITWGTGHMRIDLDKFFPVTQADLKKLLKKGVAHDWEYGDELLERLLNFFQEKLKFNTVCFEDSGREYLNIKEKNTDLERLVLYMKRPNGLPLTKDEHKQAKADLKKGKSEERRLLSVTKESQRAIKSFEGHITIVQAEITKWGG